MARRGSKNTAGQTRTEQERARLYRARAQWNTDQKQRRVRDNVIAAVAGGALVVAAFASQAVHAAVTQPAPEPTPTPSVSPTPAPTETTEPEPEVTDAPAEGETPGEEATPEPTETPAP